ncbi:MAG: CRISPR-associated protein Cas4 [Candidatus Methylomirabilales bacterium]
MTKGMTATQFELVVSDVKQYAYCARIPFYHYVLPVEKKPTFKMEHGKEAHQIIEALEKRRKFRAYGLDKAERIFNVWLRAAHLGLIGKLDLLLKTETECFPVDFKYTQGRARRNHLLQLTAYGLLVEEAFQCQVGRGFIYLIPENDAVDCLITDELKAEARETVVKIHAMIQDERTPPPTPVRARCYDCEFQNYCADIW